ncbi:hypothetical protein ACRAWF_20620 [Streptomyces sp. L7]
MHGTAARHARWSAAGVRHERGGHARTHQQPHAPQDRGPRPPTPGGTVRDDGDGHRLRHPDPVTLVQHAQIGQLLLEHIEVHTVRSRPAGQQRLRLCRPAATPTRRICPPASRSCASAVSAARRLRARARSSGAAESGAQTARVGTHPGGDHVQRHKPDDRERPANGRPQHTPVRDTPPPPPTPRRPPPRTPRTATGRGADEARQCTSRTSVMAQLCPSPRGKGCAMSGSVPAARLPGGGKVPDGPQECSHRRLSTAAHRVT